MSTKPDFALIAERTAGHELLEQLLAIVKQSIRPWPLLSESEQLAVIDKLRGDVERAIQYVVRTVSAAGAQTVLASVESVTYKKRVKAVLTIARGAAAAQLAERASSDILLVLADPKDHLEGVDQVRPDKGQVDFLQGDGATAGEA